MIPFTGRYHLVRNWWLPTGEVSAPFVLDRRDKVLREYRGVGSASEEWEAVDINAESRRAWERFQRTKLNTPSARRLAERYMQQPQFERMAALFGSGETSIAKLFYDTEVSSQLSLALDSNYLAGSAGDASGMRYFANGRTLSSVYVYISSYTGTAANVNDLNFELRPESSVGAATPNTSTLTESKTLNPASAIGWVAATGWTTVLTSGSRFFILVGDADGGGGSYATVLTRSVMQDSAVGIASTRFMPVTTTNGWIASSTNTASWPSMVLGFSDGSAIGNSLTVNTAPATDTNRRGLRITSAGLIADIPLFGAVWTRATPNGMEIYNNANAPGTSPANSSTDLFYGATANEMGCLTSGGTPYTLAAGTAYRIVATFGSNSSGGPRRMDIGTGEDATLRKAMPGTGEFYYSHANGTTDWSGDLVGSLPAMGLLIDGQVAPAGGGGGGGAVYPIFRGAIR